MMSEQGSSTSDRSGWWAFVLLLLFGATTTPVLWKSTDRHDPPQPATPQPATKSCALAVKAGSPLRPLEEYWQLIDESSSAQPAKERATKPLELVDHTRIDWASASLSFARLMKFKRDSAGKQEGIGRGADKYEVRSLIVCVPDPEQSHFGFRFDTAVSAVQLAAFEAGYVQEGHELPWSRSDKDSRETQMAQCEAVRPPSTYEPGTILFRKRPKCIGEKQELLLAFLVGESPILGLHGIAFERSVFACRWLDEQFSANHKPYHLRVLGPCFSGSQSSVRDTLCRLAAKQSDLKNLRVRMISGGAVSMSPGHLLSEVNQGCRDATFLEFSIANWPHQVVLSQMLEHLKDMNGGTMPLTAMLVESSTGFGARSLRDKNYTSIPFPLHVSKVQTHYERQRADRASRVSPTNSSSLPVDFEESSIAPDSLAPFAPGMASVMVDRMLDNVLTTLAEEDFRYVGIIATDTRDKLFLANLARRYCPDAQLISTSSDLLLTHPDYNESLKGMLVGSAYPLYPRNQLWTQPLSGKSVRLQFANQSDQGTYNAACALLDAPGECANIRPPSSCREWMARFHQSGFRSSEITI